MARRAWKALACLTVALSLLCGCGGGKGAANLPEKPANGAVLDVAGVLTDETVQRILDQNKVLAPVGAKMTVVTVDVLGGKTAAEYAAGLWDAWALDGGDRNGVLALLAIGEEQYYLIQGSAIAGDLTDEALSDFTWTYLERDFANGDYDAGVRKLCDGLNTWYQGHYAQALGLTQPDEEETRSQSGGGGFPWLAVVLAVAAVCAIALVVFKLRSGGGGRRARRYQGRRRR